MQDTECFCEAGRLGGRARKTGAVYMPYGYRSVAHVVSSLLGFNGQRLEAHGLYLLGNGRRTYCPNLMRFYSPDKLSPFGVGGLNAYAYVLGDPVNKDDPTGQMPGPKGKGGKIRWQNTRPTSSEPAGPSSSQSHRTSEKAPPRQMPKEPWTVEDEKALKLLKGNQLSESARNQYDLFKTHVSQHPGPLKAMTETLGALHFEKLLHGYYSIRLNSKDRVYFTVEDRVIRIRKIGGHNPPY